MNQFKRYSIKRFVSGLTATVFSTLLIATPINAATDSQILSAVQKGVNYLAANQKADGAIDGFGGETDWAAISLEASGNDAFNFNHKGSSIIDFLTANPLTSAASATDIERRILAIMATGGDASGFGGVDYSSRLLAQHNNQQIGDATLLNDDIFGIIAIKSMDNPALNAIAQDALNYLISHQAADGGFSYTTDTCGWCGSDSNDTAAAIVAMYAAENMGLTSPDLESAKTKAISYLLSTRQVDGGFGYDAFSPSDGSSTAWSLIALNVVGSHVATQASSAKDWLLANQNGDGGFRYGAYDMLNSDTYTTSHAMIALLGTTWTLSPEPLSAPVVIKPPTEPTYSNPESSAQNPTNPVSSVSPGTNNESESTPPGPTDESPEAVIQAGSDGESESPADAPKNDSPQTLGDRTTALNTGQKAPAPAGNNQSKSNYPLYGLYGLMAIGLVGSIWYAVNLKKL